MQHARGSNQGFTLIELRIVVAMVAVMAMIAAPRFSAMARRQDTRDMVQRVSNVMANARSEAIRSGNNQLVLFDFPTDGNIRLIDDTNNDWAVSGGEQVVDVNLTGALDGDVTRWGVLADRPSASAVADEGGSMPSDGSTFPIDFAPSAAAVGFTSRGIPVSLPTFLGGPAGAPGAGTGTYYVTDNDELVYAATLLPLGATRVRGYRPVTDDWY